LFSLLTTHCRYYAGLWEEHGVSSILVVGGAGDYLGVADTVIVMDDYAAHDATERAKAIIAQYNPTASSSSTKEAAAAEKSPFAALPTRAPDSAACTAKGRTKALTMQRFQYGDNNDCDISGLEQVVEEGQTRAIMHAIAALAGAMNPRRSLLELSQLLE
jgi:predicted ABC-class ATPase